LRTISMQCLTTALLGLTTVALRPSSLTTTALRPSRARLAMSSTGIDEVLSDLRVTLKTLQDMSIPDNKVSEVIWLSDEIATVAKQTRASATGAVAERPAAVAVSSPPPSSPASMDAVRDALSDLFKHYDADKDGVVSLADVTQGDRLPSMTEADRSSSTWESRQVRAGERRLRRMFKDGSLSANEFVNELSGQFAQRVDRGLSIGRAVAEIQVHYVSEGEMYGSE